MSKDHRGRTVFAMVATSGSKDALMSVFDVGEVLIDNDEVRYCITSQPRHNTTIFCCTAYMVKGTGHQEEHHAPKETLFEPLTFWWYIPRV